MSGTLQINEALGITYNRLYIILFTLIVFGLLQLVLKRTRLGLNIRAVAQNRGMARAMGVRSEWVDAMTFGLGSGIAGVAGVALSQLTNVGPNLGQAYIIDSFMVVVFGGVGNLWGALIGGMSMGIVNQLLEPFAGAVLAKIAVLVALILFIQRRPRGLFPQAGRAAESQSVAVAIAVLQGRRGRAVAARRCCRYWRSSLPLSTLLTPASSALHLSPYVMTLIGKYLCYAHARAGRGSDLGLLRHPQPRARRVLLARRLRHGHVSDAPDRDARGLRRSGAARLHGLPELEEPAVVLVGLQSLLAGRDHDGARAGRCSRWCSDGSPSGRASPASTSRSSPRR